MKRDDVNVFGTFIETRAVNKGCTNEILAWAKELQERSRLEGRLEALREARDRIGKAYSERRNRGYASRNNSIMLEADGLQEAFEIVNNLISELEEEKK